MLKSRLYSLTSRLTIERSTRRLGKRKTILFDTGGNGSVLMENMEKLKINPPDAVMENFMKEQKKEHNSDSLMTEKLKTALPDIVMENFMKE